MGLVISGGKQPQQQQQQPTEQRSKEQRSQDEQTGEAGSHAWYDSNSRIGRAHALMSLAVALGSGADSRKRTPRMLLVCFKIRQQLKCCCCAVVFRVFAEGAQWTTPARAV